MPIALGAVLALSVWMVKSIYQMKQDVAVMTVEVRGFEQLKKDVSIALSMLKQHGDEFNTVTEEQLRLRTVYDELAKKVDTKTADRFTGSDASELRDWVRDELNQRDKISELQHEALMREIELLDSH